MIILAQISQDSNLFDTLGIKKENGQRERAIAIKIK